MNEPTCEPTEQQRMTMEYEQKRILGQITEQYDNSMVGSLLASMFINFMVNTQSEETCARVAYEMVKHMKTAFERRRSEKEVSGNESD